MKISSVDFEIEIPYDRLGKRFMRCIYSLERGPDGQVRPFVAAITDLTDRKHAELSLREADRRKNEFLAMLAHELRNPLAPIPAAGTSH